MNNWKLEGQLGHGSADLHAGAMAGLLNLVNEWLIRALVLSSLAAHLVLVLLAGIRRRRAIGGRTALLWLAYQVANWAATHSLSKLFLGSTSREQQLVAFWTPFLLMHLGRPDNISAYSLEDNMLSGRQVLGVPAQVGVAIYVLYKHIIIGGGDAGTLLPASFLMFFLGIAKYVEGAVALWRGNLGSIRSSLKKARPKSLGSADHQSGCLELGNEQALLVAHGLLHISKGAFADFSFGWKNPKFSRKANVFSRSHGWKDMCRVVEMELSLMYDILYTKAAMVHTWGGYLIRLVSPLATAVAFLLFWSYSKDGQRAEDVAITYVLLVATFVLDVRWLFGALGSTWTYAFFYDRSKLLPSAQGTWWRGLRRFFLVTSLVKKDPTNYRMWSGTVGQYNLFRESTHDTTSLCSGIVKKMGWEDSWMEYQYGYSKGLDILPFVRELLFKKIWDSLKSAYPPPAEEKMPPPAMMPAWPTPELPDQRAGHVRRGELDDALEFGHEFQEVILTWHVATNIFLLCKPREAALSFKHVKAIKELSNYMMFLVAVRPNMVPGLKLRSLHEATRDDLKKIWRCRHGGDKDSNDPAAAAGSTARDKELASILRKMERPDNNDHRKSALYDINIILSSGTQYAELMLRRLSAANFGNNQMTEKSFDRFGYLLPKLWRGDVLDVQQMLEHILDAWVRLLIHASTRCSRDSHAKQLSRGGELTTVVWILAEHAGIFRIPQHN